MHHAEATAVADWGWTPVAVGPGKAAWINHDGERVNYVADRDGLRGLVGIRLYCGFGWHDRNEFNEVPRLAAAYRWHLVRDGKKAEKAAAP